MSFFDEDDEPLRTTSRTRTQARVRPRSGRPAGSGAAPDSQALLIRRMVAAIIGVIILLVLFFVVKTCNDTRHENALKDYNRQVSGIATESSQNGQEFFQQLGAGGSQSPQQLYQEIVSFKGTAEQHLTKAQGLDVPGDMKDAHQSLLIALELRRDALEAIGEQIRPALGDEGEAADRAINAIAAQNRAFDASDVLYKTRVIPFIRDALDKAEVGGQAITESAFMPEISWVGPQYVASKLGQQLTTGGEEGSGSGRGEPTGPGLHGTGLDATSYGNVTLQPGTPNRLVYTAGQAFTVSFTNQGDNDEFNIKVTLRIARASGSPMTLSKTVPRVAKGEKMTVELPLNREPPIGVALTISVNVASVPGEKTTDNNKSSYPTLFEQG